MRLSFDRLVLILRWFWAKFLRSVVYRYLAYRWQMREYYRRDIWNLSHPMVSRHFYPEAYTRYHDARTRWMLEACKNAREYERLAGIRCFDVGNLKYFLFMSLGYILR